MKIAPLAVALLLLLGGCGGADPSSSPPPPAAGPAPRFPLSITDADGRQITIPARPERIVSLSPAHTETVYALGAGSRLIAADTYSDYPPEAKKKAKLNCFPRPPLERIVAYKPDLVLVMTEDGDRIRRMEGAGLRVLKLFPQTYESALHSVALLGRVLDTRDAAENLAAQMRARRAEVESRVKGATPPRVLFELDAMNPARPYVAGGGGFYGELIGIAGGKNVFGDDGAPSLQVGTEQVIARDPEVILLGDSQSPSQPQTPALVRKRAGWDGIAGVRKGAIYPVDSTRITRPGPRLAEGLEEIARLLHPERFR